MKNLKKALVSLTETYLASYPIPADIALFKNALKLTYSFTIPSSNSKNSYEQFYPLPFPNKVIETNKSHQALSQRLHYDQKGNRIQISNSFFTANVQGKHQKVIQDSVFGKAKKAKNANRWVYIAKLKQQKAKSIFDLEQMGEGKKTFEGDFGQTYQGISKVGIFVWDTDTRKVHALQIDNSIIPACPIFANEQGTKIMFHGYKRQNFPFGILHCFNRTVDIYEATFTVEQSQKEVENKGKKTIKKQTIVKTEVSKLEIQNANETNIFPNISPCFQYLIFFQGKGITHTYYLDFVIMKRTPENKWKQTHRIKEKFIGYYDTFASHMIKKDDKTYVFTQTIEDSCQKIYRIDLQTGEIINFSNNDKGSSFGITESVQNMLLGVYTSVEQRNFFYTDPNTLQINHIEPFKKKRFNQVEMTEITLPIHAFLLQLQKQQVIQQFKHNAVDGKRPMVINIHGGPHGAINPCLTLTSYLLLKCGYTVLLPNFSGSAGFGNEYLIRALKNPGSENSKQIIQLMTKVLKQKPEISAENVHIMGGSYGGYMTAYLGAHHPKHFRSGVVINGVLSILGQLWYTDIPEWSAVQGSGHSNLYDLTAQDYVQMWKQSPISQPMKIPTLQILGAKDRRVPWRQGLLFDAIAKDKGTHIETFVYQNSGHSLSDSVETSIDYTIKIMMFFEKENWQQQQKAENSQ